MKDFINVKKMFGTVLGLLTITNSVFAMTFSHPVEIGEVGFPVQASYHGFIIRGESHNTGTPCVEDLRYFSPEESRKTYEKGIARFGTGEDALYCDYDFKSNDYAHSIKFGGEKSYVIALDGTYKEVFRIDNTDKMPLYAIYHQYCVTELNIIGRQKDGEWVSYINSKDISQKYFNGKDAYKEDGGVMYDKPICRNDSIVVVYRRWHWKGMSDPEGEFRFQWNDKTQRFSIEQVVY